MLVLLGCEAGGPGGPDPAAWIVEIHAGANQSTRPGQPLLTPLQVRVREGTAAVVGATVRWSVTTGDGASLMPALGTTDADGVASTIATLGPVAGDYGFLAQIENGESATFSAEAVAAPVVVGTSVAGARAGDTVSVMGEGLWVPDSTRVLFSGVPGRVLAGEPSRLDVEVPPCLPERSVEVTVRIGATESAPRTLSISALGDPLTLEMGQAALLDPCVRMVTPPASSHLLVVTSAATGALGPVDYALAGLVGASSGGGARVAAPLVHQRKAWSALSPRASNAGSPVSALPVPGEVKTFNVLNAMNLVDTVHARVRIVGDYLAAAVDTLAPPPGFADEDLRDFVAEFDDVVAPTLHPLFGTPSDIDGNGRVFLLATPAVNRLSPPDSEAFIGGFFFGGDLSDTNTFANGAEILYAATPDVDGEHGVPVTPQRLRESLPAVLAHEYQHMIHHAVRMRELGAENPEALWLSEALAQMAEDRVARALRDRGEPERAALYDTGNRDRAIRYLREPQRVSLLIRSGGGTLEERGAGWTFLRYLTDRFGPTILTDLTRSTRTGVQNVAAAASRPWEEVVVDWTMALAVDGTAGAPAPWQFASTDLRALLDDGDGFPLEPVTLDGGDTQVADAIFPATAAYYLIPPEAGDRAWTLTGPAGSPLPVEWAVTARVVRIR